MSNPAKYLYRSVCQWFLAATSMTLLTDSGSEEGDREMSDARLLVKFLAAMLAVWLVLRLLNWRRNL
jgi:hypothetical protein